jgi:hypothetical protein
MLERELGIKTELVEGGRGEFTVSLNEVEIARKGWLGFPKDEKILEAVKNHLAR